MQVVQRLSAWKNGIGKPDSSSGKVSCVFVVLLGKFAFQRGAMVSKVCLAISIITK